MFLASDLPRWAWKCHWGKHVDKEIQTGNQDDHRVFNPIFSQYSVTCLAGGAGAFVPKRRP